MAEDAEGLSVLAVAPPDHDEVAFGVRGGDGGVLKARRVGVDLERYSLGHTCRVEALAGDTALASVLAKAGPDDDEVTVRVRSHGWAVLCIRGVRVDLEFAPGNELSPDGGGRRTENTGEEHKILHRDPSFLEETGSERVTALRCGSRWIRFRLPPTPYRRNCRAAPSARAKSRPISRTLQPQTPVTTNHSSSRATVRFTCSCRCRMDKPFLGLDLERLGPKSHSRYRRECHC